MLMLMLALAGRWTCYYGARTKVHQMQLLTENSPAGTIMLAQHWTNSISPVSHAGEAQTWFLIEI